MEKTNKQTKIETIKEKRKIKTGGKVNINSYDVRKIRSCGFRNKITRKGDTFGIRFATPSVQGALHLRSLYSVPINLIYKTSSIT
jgi:hypothetical protein